MGINGLPNTLKTAFSAHFSATIETDTDNTGTRDQNSKFLSNAG